MSGTFFDMLCLIMTDLDIRMADGLKYCGALGSRDRLELRMAAPEFCNK